jgi:hypothetical protein
VFPPERIGVLASAELNRHGTAFTSAESSTNYPQNIGHFAKLPPKIRVKIWQHLSIPVKPKDDEGSNEELPGSKSDKDIERKVAAFFEPAGNFTRKCLYMSTRRKF